ncbi:MAG: thioredoxin family protein [Burkholderiaceae bacterium]|nr:thioredoxin family protein [Burkholderiaceae bacterium]
MAAEGKAEQLGVPAPDFALPGVDGRIWTRDQCRGPNGLLVIFLCNHCPYVQAAIARIVRDARELTAHGIDTVGINANDPSAYPEDSFDAMKTYAQRWALPFPYLFDETQQVARAYGAVCTPDFFGYDARLQLQYRGRLDAGRKDPPPPGAARELFDAMVQIARTGMGPPLERQQPSIGCSIKWRPA